MNDIGTDDAFREIQRRIRVVAILHTAHRSGLTPLPLLQFHAIAYFADALAPVWGENILDAQLLKRREGPISPVFQHDLDRLVGSGVVMPHDVSHVFSGDGGWRLDAKYTLNSEMARPVLDATGSFPEQARTLLFLQEVVLAMSALDIAGIGRASVADAAYGNEMVDSGGLVDIGGDRGHLNVTAQVALRFGELLSTETNLTNAEMIHFYIRELNKRMQSHAA